VLPPGELTCIKLAIVRSQKLHIFWRSLIIFMPVCCLLINCIGFWKQFFFIKFLWRHVTQKGQIVTPMRLETDNSKTAGERDSVPKVPPIGNDLWGIEWSRDRCCHMTPKGQTRVPNMFRAQYVENSWKCYLASCYLLDSLLWGSTVGYPSDSLASCSIYKNLIHSCILRYLTFNKLQKVLNSVKI